MLFIQTKIILPLT